MVQQGSLTTLIHQVNNEHSVKHDGLGLGVAMVDGVYGVFWLEGDTLESAPVYSIAEALAMIGAQRASLPDWQLL